MFTYRDGVPPMEKLRFAVPAENPGVIERFAPGKSDDSFLTGISGLSFDSTCLSPLYFFYLLLLLSLVLSFFLLTAHFRYFFFFFFVSRKFISSFR